MHFDLFRTIGGKGERCTQDLFLSITQSDEIKAVAREVAEGNLDAKRRLPAITWQAWFDEGKRKNSLAHSSGLFMLDIDHIDGDVYNYMNRLFDGKSKDELGIVVVHKTPSCQGLRIVARVNPLCPTIATNQKWLADTLGIENYDDVCKDFARMSFLVPFEYIYYIDNAIFKQDEDNNKNSEIYYIDNPDYVVCNDNADTSGALGTDRVPDPERSDDSSVSVGRTDSKAKGKTVTNASADSGDTDCDFSGAGNLYKGLHLEDIAKRWLQENGGEPVEGDRNSQLFHCACALRYICNFKGSVLLSILPDYGLPRGEMQSIVKSALHEKRAQNVPISVRRVVGKMLREQKAEEEENYKPAKALKHLLNSEECIDHSLLPPIFRQYADILAPEFQTAGVMALLPMLGTIGSKLRAKYRDGRTQTPSFQVEIEAPAGTGKSFVRDIYDEVMAGVEALDNMNREREMEYRDKLRRAKNDKKQPESEHFLIRLTPPTTSVSMLLQRIKDADGVHVFSFTDEMKVVMDAMKRGSFGDLRAMMRNAFDNAKFGQDYKSDQSTNVVVRIFYNTLHCGTPKVYRQFYNDSEDGTVTRVIFCNIEQEIGALMPENKIMTARNRLIVNKAIARLNNVTMDGDEVRTDETWLTDFDFMNKWAKNWCKEKSDIARQYKNNEINIFLRRAAVVGFRAAMIAWYLWGKQDKTTKVKVEAFAEWVAEYMLWKLCQRYSIDQVSNIVPYREIFMKLEDTFTTEEVDYAIEELESKASSRNVCHIWCKRGIVERIAHGKYKKI
ncbi:MAG: DUF3987 domain-containing protein [Bacteroidaceae bacterium]|nr:DUF3987 domain-containing protein [Bacteroidaceae bacterium]